ncbi:MAG TPA: hypothetical protein VFW30_00150 [Bryocella sp.]|nr:hypothetical protein [Bryocella sp.]
MAEGRQREGLMANSLDDPLADAVLAKGEPSFAALAALYPGKVLDRTVLGSYSDPNTPVTGSNEEFVVWWNGAISANLITEQVGNNTRSVAENTNILFRVGPRGEMFGKEGTRFSHLGYEDGYLPIVNASYTCDGVRYSETAFAERPAGHNQDTAYVRFEMTNLSSGTRSAELQEQLTLLDSSRVSVSGPRMLDASGKVLLAFAGGETTFDAARQQLTHRVRLAPHSIAHIIFKIPYTPELPEQTALPTAEEFIAVHARVRGFWNHLLSDGVQIRVPEKRVNDMWRALLLQNFVIADGPRFTYGSGLEYNNSYYPFEDGFAAIAMARYGFGKDAEAWLNYLIPSSIDPKSAGYRYQNRRAMPLFLLYEEYRLTGHSDYFNENKSALYGVAEQIIRDRHTTMESTDSEKPWHWGLLPPARPAVDARAATSSNYVVAHDITNCQGLQNFGEFLVETRIDVARGKRYLSEAADFRASILRAMEKSVVRSPGKPPFVPLQTLYFRDTPNYGPEPYDDLAKGRVEGSYYHYWADMELHYNFFNPDDQLAHWIVDYLQQRGGFVLGCTRARNRADAPYGWINDNYNAGFYSYALRRGEVNRFLLGFYSRLAFDSSVNTYLNSEGAPFIFYNTEDGGFVGAEYTFPNSASNAETLDLLRFMLILEERKDNMDTGVISLARGTPRAWLQDGNEIGVERAPTDFGTMSFTIQSKLHAGIISARIQAPTREKYQSIRLYLRPPGSLHLKSVRVNGKDSNDFDAANENITLAAGPAEFDVKAEYR